MTYIICIGPAYLYECVRWGVRAEARGIWGHAPPGNFFWNWCCEIASEAILGSKTSLLIIAFAQAWYQDSDSLQVCTHGDKWPSAVSSSLRTTREGATHASRLEFCLILRNQSENVWPPRSKSARSHISPALCYVRSVTFVRAWIQTIRGLLAWKQRVGDAVAVKTLVWQTPVFAGSAGPAPPPLISGNLALFIGPAQLLSLAVQVLAENYDSVHELMDGYV